MSSDVAQRGPASFLFEDLLVASARFAMARRRTMNRRPGRRPVRSRSKDAVADLEHHRRMLVDVTRWLTEVGGGPRGDGLSAADLRCARRTAAARLRNGDCAHGRCQCSAACGRRWPVAPRRRANVHHLLPD